MARPVIKAPASEGICSFCQSPIDKSKMTRHLKSCKERKSAIEKEAVTSSGPEVKLFHILVEGQYNPQYWMHLELPASEELDTLDAFLRSIWLECCGHLSAFRIDGTSYDSEPEEMGFVVDGMDDGEEVGEDGVADPDEEEYPELTGDTIVDFGKVLDEVPLFRVGYDPVALQLPAEWLAEVRKPRSIDEFVAFAKEELKAIPKGGPYGSKVTPEAVEEFRCRYEQRHLLETLLLLTEDRSLYVPLQKVLKVGQKFSHEYDFGSTTYLSLKVMAEREGHIQKEDDPVTILARNVPPTFLCRVCGKPATQVESGGYYNAAEVAYCDECARKKCVDTLPIVNSPRVGVCGYTGDAEWSGGEEWDGEEEWDDEEEDED
jgi:hypothetical protein